MKTVPILCCWKTACDSDWSAFENMEHHGCILHLYLRNWPSFSILNSEHRMGMPSDAHSCMCFVSSSPNFFLRWDIVGEFGNVWEATFVYLDSSMSFAYHHVITVSIEHLSAHKIRESSCSMLQPGVLKRNMPNFSIFPAPFECIIFRTSSDESCAKRSSKLGWISLGASCITSWK